MNAVADVQFSLNPNNEENTNILTGHDRTLTVAFCSKVGDEI